MHLVLDLKIYPRSHLVASVLVTLEQRRVLEVLIDQGRGVVVDGRLQVLRTAVGLVVVDSYFHWDLGYVQDFVSDLLIVAAEDAGVVPGQVVAAAVVVAELGLGSGLVDRVPDLAVLGLDLAGAVGVDFGMSVGAFDPELVEQQEVAVVGVSS